jgi:hypothetical protein
MPGAAPGFGKELSAGYRKNNPGVKETGSTFPMGKKVGRLAGFANTIGEDLGRKGAAQLESKQRAAGKTPLVSAPAKGAASAGRSPGGKRSRKHNIRGG